MESRTECSEPLGSIDISNPMDLAQLVARCSNSGMFAYFYPVQGGDEVWIPTSPHTRPGSQWPGKLCGTSHSKSLQSNLAEWLPWMGQFLRKWNLH